jgi:hypothetical protein
VLGEFADALGKGCPQNDKASLQKLQRSIYEGYTIQSCTKRSRSMFGLRRGCVVVEQAAPGLVISFSRLCLVALELVGSVLRLG